MLAILSHIADTLSEPVLLYSLCVFMYCISVQVLVQLLDLPCSITSARQLAVIIEPYTIRVERKATGQVLLQGQLARGIVPEDSTWTFTPPPKNSQTSNITNNSSSSSSSSSSSGVGAAAAGLVACAVGSNAVEIAAAEQYGEGRLLLLLTKLNLELYER
jgi:hypothetical protein